MRNCSLDEYDLDRNPSTPEDECNCLSGFEWFLEGEACARVCPTTSMYGVRAVSTPLDECECASGKEWFANASECVRNCSYDSNHLIRALETAVDECECREGFIWSTEKNPPICVLNCSDIIYGITLQGD